MSKFDSISSFDDIIDSRAVIARIDYLSDPDYHEEGLTDDETAELTALRVLAESGESMRDWSFGLTLVRESHFVEYAEELAGDTDLLQGESADWPFRHIDWQAAADELRGDYTSFVFRSWDFYPDELITYYAR
jgi:hypothetical protein